MRKVKLKDLSTPKINIITVYYNKAFVFNYHSCQCPFYFQSKVRIFYAEYVCDPLILTILGQYGSVIDVDSF